MSPSAAVRAAHSCEQVSTRPLPCVAQASAHFFADGHAGQRSQPQPVLQPFGGATQDQAVGATTLVKSVTLRQISLALLQKSGPQGNVPGGTRLQPTVAERSTPPCAAAHVLA